MSKYHIHEKRHVIPGRKACKFDEPEERQKITIHELGIDRAAEGPGILSLTNFPALFRSFRGKPIACFPVFFFSVTCFKQRISVAFTLHLVANKLLNSCPYNFVKVDPFLSFIHNSFLACFVCLLFYSCQSKLHYYGLTFLAASTIIPHVAKAM